MNFINIKNVNVLLVHVPFFKRTNQSVKFYTKYFYIKELMPQNSSFNGHNRDKWQWFCLFCFVYFNMCSEDFISHSLEKKQKDILLHYLTKSECNTWSDVGSWIPSWHIQGFHWLHTPPGPTLRHWISYTPV